MFTGDLFVAGQNRAAALAQIQCDIAALGINGNHGCRNDLMSAGLHLTALGAALRLADALPDHVLGSLRRDAAKLLGLELGDELLADLVALADTLSILQADLGVGVLDLLDDLPCKACAERPDAGVNVDDDVLILDLIIFLDRNHDGCLDLFDQVISRQAALLFQCGKRLKELVIVGCSCHFFGFLPKS